MGYGAFASSGNGSRRGAGCWSIGSRCCGAKPAPNRAHGLDLLLTLSARADPSGLPVRGPNVCRDAIEHRPALYVSSAAQNCQSLKAKRVTTHTRPRPVQQVHRGVRSRVIAHVRSASTSRAALTCTPQRGDCPLGAQTGLPQRRRTAPVSIDEQGWPRASKLSIATSATVPRPPAYALPD